MANRERVANPETRLKIPQIGVIGGSKSNLPENLFVQQIILNEAEEVGRELARQGAILISGGTDGIMEACSKGSREEGGVTVGTPGRKRGSSNSFVSVEICTPIDIGDFAFAGIHSCDSIIVFPGGAGTLAELAQAYRLKKPMIIIQGFDEWYDSLVDNWLDRSQKVRFIGAGSAKEASKIAMTEAKNPGSTNTNADLAHRDREGYLSALEQFMITYSDLRKTESGENRERLVAIDTTPFKHTEPLVDMKKLLGESIYVRQDVNRRLGLAREYINWYSKDKADLLVTYGYRAPSIQQKYFERYLAKLRPEYASETELLEAVHKKVAVPEVAGHPTGGAVDVALVNRDGDFLDHGTKIYDLSTKEVYTFNPFLAREQKNRRVLLRKAMMSAGFAPFDGEWWHFSYGDREWASYFGVSRSLYSPVDEEKLNINTD